MGVTTVSHRLVGWTPTALVFDDRKPAVRWCFTEGIEFTDPMFNQTIERCLRDPFRLLFWRRTDMDVLAEFVTASPGLEPSGFIFHLSRCGSTLVAQMLAALSEALVMSEPPSFDHVLRAPTFCPDLSPKRSRCLAALDVVGPRTTSEARSVSLCRQTRCVGDRPMATDPAGLSRYPVYLPVSRPLGSHGLPPGSTWVSHDPRHTLDRRCRTRSRRRAATQCRGVLRLCPESALRGRS